MDEQAMTIRLPRPLYERLRREAFDQRRPMNELIIEGLGARFSALDGGGEIRHLDGDLRNNAPDNLRVKTPARKRADPRQRANER